ncbi:SAM-dependent methyltransferase [Paenibacillus sp.]|uniref:SAM-dependent methyltransferase n=1 Tax=Paenibacillus sp. TaxID=58172 RepID=UPI002D42F807|nr:SAM-dependent methyltransferase [Paenibacillus sp.]HZG56032.1 SAM-dependent methyltransferase [Paenibacillus sp.]
MDSSETKLTEETENASAEGSVWIGTANRGFGKLAANELQRLFGKAKTQSLSPGDVFRFEVDEPREAALRCLRERPPVFLRHVQPVHAAVPLGGEAEAALAAIRTAVAEADAPLSGKKVAVQARKAEAPQTPKTELAPIDVKRAVDDALTAAHGAIPVVQDMEYIVSVYLARDTAYVGWSTPRDNLSSWSGGAVHFRKEDGDISRAKFKLMEAEVAFGIDFGAYHSALDIGAAPGGWSSFLLEKGLRVTAVDPADMHPSLLREHGFTYIKKNAADVTFPANEFDLLVCDMSWDPLRMAELVKRLLPSVSRDGLVLTTVKLMHGKAFATLREVESIMAPEAKLVQAKQLFHNREELTCRWRRSS